MALSNCTSSVLSLLQPKATGGSSKLHIPSSLSSSLHCSQPNFHLAAALPRLLPLIPVLAWNPPNGGGNNHSQLLGLVIPRKGGISRRCGNSNRNKPSTKIYVIERKSSGRRVSLLRQMATYGGTHRILHPCATLQ